MCLYSTKVISDIKLQCVQNALKQLENKAIGILLYRIAQRSSRRTCHGRLDSQSRPDKLFSYDFWLHIIAGLQRIVLLLPVQCMQFSGLGCYYLLSYLFSTACFLPFDHHLFAFPTLSLPWHNLISLFRNILYLPSFLFFVFEWPLVTRNIWKRALGNAVKSCRGISHPFFPREPTLFTSTSCHYISAFICTFILFFVFLEVLSPTLIKAGRFNPLTEAYIYMEDLLYIRFVAHMYSVGAKFLWQLLTCCMPISGHKSFASFWFVQNLHSFIGDSRREEA